MDAESQARFDARARVVKALAHPTRLFMIDELARQERCVQDLTELVGVDISTISKHLSVLKSAGVVVTDKRGTQVFYSLRDACVLHFFSCIERVLRESSGQQLEAVE